MSSIFLDRCLRCSREETTRRKSRRKRRYDSRPSHLHVHLAKTCLYYISECNASTVQSAGDSEQECTPRSVRPENWRGSWEDRTKDAPMVVRFARVAWLRASEREKEEEAAKYLGILSDPVADVRPGLGFHHSHAAERGFRMGGTLDLTETTPTSTPHATARHQ